MGRVSRRARLGAVIGALLACATPMTVGAALLWTMTISPQTTTTDVPTKFTLTAANLLLGRLECLRVQVPDLFRVDGVALVHSSAGDSWVADHDGNLVTVRTTSGGDRLELLDTVTFAVDATAGAAGAPAWHAAAYDGQDCGGAGSELGAPPVVVVTGPVATPTPKPTLAPTPTPIPTLPLPVPLPTLSLPDDPVPTPHAEPTPTDRPSPTESPRPGDGDATRAALDGPSIGGGGPQPPAVGVLADVAGAGDAAGAPMAPRVAFHEPELDLDVASLGLTGGAAVWVVPVATIGGPGLIVVLWVALQAGGVSLWIPAARRLRGKDPSGTQART